ncbi:MAG: hypothetical protein JWN22_1325 [Nocardioides sp.]|jgi:hypothetical protein|nr:hypothetical protein [Nocardioides sp.]
MSTSNYPGTPERHLRSIAPPETEVPAEEAVDRTGVEEGLRVSRAKIDVFLSQFPPEVRGEVIDGMYSDGDGEFRTTWRLLRDARDPVPEAEGGPYPAYEDDQY